MLAKFQPARRRLSAMPNFVELFWHSSVWVTRHRTAMLWGAGPWVVTHAFTLCRAGAFCHRSNHS